MKGSERPVDLFAPWNLEFNDGLADHHVNLSINGDLADLRVMELESQSGSTEISVANLKTPIKA